MGEAGGCFIFMLVLFFMLFVFSFYAGLVFDAVLFFENDGFVLK